MKRVLATSLSVGLMAFSGMAFVASAADYPPTTLKVVGGGSHNYTFTAVEKPFWQEQIPKASNGAIKAEFSGLVESGLKGPEIVRLMRSGALDVGMGVLAAVSGDDASFEGIDLPGMALDIETAKKISDAYRPVLDKRLQERHGIKLLATFPYTAQVLFCRREVKQLDDLKGLKIRTRGSNMAAFVAKAGGSPVTMPFAEVITALQTGVVDCAATGIGSGNAAKWFEVANYLYNAPIDWSLSFYGMGKKRWDKLDPAVRTLLETETKKMETDLWTETARENEYALACNTGKGECKIHTQTNMIATAPNAQDKARLQQIAADVATEWGKRCGADCVKEWNATAGKAIGVAIK